MTNNSTQISEPGNQSKKDQIIEVAATLFNRHGLSNVTMRMIADALGLSAGNLHYHYKTKQEIVEAVCEKARKDFEDIPMLDEMVFVGGMGLDHAQKGAAFARRYPFLYANAGEIKYYGANALASAQAISKRALSIIQTAIYIGIGKGYLQMEPFEGYYAMLSKTILNEIFMRAVRHELLGDNPDEEPNVALCVGVLLFRNYTEKGAEMFRQRMQGMGQ